MPASAQLATLVSEPGLLSVFRAATAVAVVAALWAAAEMLDRCWQARNDQACDDQPQDATKETPA